MKGWDKAASAQGVACATLALGLPLASLTHITAAIVTTTHAQGDAQQTRTSMQLNGNCEDFPNTGEHDGEKRNTNRALHSME